MSDRESERSLSAADATSARLEAEIDRLRAANEALAAQQQLLSTWVSTARMAAGKVASHGLTLRALLQQILELAQALVGAESGSLFLLDAEGRVGESLLVGGGTIREQKRNLVGQVLEEGLAAWAVRNQQVALIADTKTDPRWVELPDRPYSTRSALCVPLLRGKRLLGVMTLMHSQPQAFLESHGKRMGTVAESMALVLEAAQLCWEEAAPAEASAPIATPAPPPTPERPVEREPRRGREGSPLENRAADSGLDTYGLFIATADGKLRYASRQFARLFGYSRRHLADLDSWLEPVAPGDRPMLMAQMHRCIVDPERPLSCVAAVDRQDGRRVSLEFYAERIRFGGEMGTLGCVRDTGAAAIDIRRGEIQGEDDDEEPDHFSAATVRIARPVKDS